MFTLYRMSRGIVRERRQILNRNLNRRRTHVERTVNIRERLNARVFWDGRRPREMTTIITVRLVLNIKR